MMKETSSSSYPHNESCPKDHTNYEGKEFLDAPDEGSGFGDDNSPKNCSCLKKWEWNVRGSGTDEDEDDIYCLLGDYKCPICLDTLINTVKVDCTYGHRFCNFCISSWVSIARQLVTECPVCRCPIFCTILDPIADSEIETILQRASKREKEVRLATLKERFRLECMKIKLYRSYHSAGAATDVPYNGSGITERRAAAGNRQRKYCRHPFFPLHETQPLQATENHQHQNLELNMINDLGLHIIYEHDYVHNSQLVGSMTLDSGTRQTSRLQMWMNPNPEPENNLTPTLNLENTNEVNDEAHGTQNRFEHEEGGEIRYQHFQYQNHQSSLWNNSFYVTPEDNTASASDESIRTSSDKNSIVWFTV